MAVTIRHALELDILKDFKIIAGEKGLSKTISMVEILDFEFVLEDKNFREKILDGDSLALSSLLYAKDHPEMILDTVKRLMALNVKALAYKPVFFKELPKEALEYAEKHDFPILEFGHDEYFEPIITGVKDLVEKERSADATELLFEEMLNRKFTHEESEAAVEKINPLLRPEIVAVCMKVEGLDENGIREVIRRGRADQRLASKTFVGKCRDTLMIILSQDKKNIDRFEALMKDVLVAYGLDVERCTVGVSNAIQIGGQIDRIVHQAYWSEKVAELENSRYLFYQNLGVYKLIISDIHSSSLVEYMETYLGPIFEDEAKEHELLHTAVQYVLEKGDAMKTAERLFCHKNTIRYRIGKLQEKLDPRANEKEFYQNLAMAIKIYLLVGREK